MKLRLSILIAVGVVMPIAATSAVAIIPGLNLLIWGTIELRREAWPQFRVTSAPQRLDATDQVRPAPNKSATILCSDLSSRDVSTGGPYRLDSLCPQSGVQVLPGSEGGFLPTRGGSDPLIPYIISPRKTKILTDRPLIRWNPVPDATRYTVQLLDPSGSVWEAEVSEAEVRYPGNPVLQPGISYAVVVTADTGVSSGNEGIPGLAFRLLDADAVQRVESSTEEVLQRNLPDGAKVFTLAYAYQNSELFAEAIERLEGIENRDDATAASHRLLGDLYIQVRLNLLAKDAYLKAVELAQREEDLKTQAEAQAALGEMYLILQDRDTAIQFLREAASTYRSLEGENSERVQQLEERIAALTT